MNVKIRMIVLFIVFALAGAPVHAAKKPIKDVAGKDHPLIGRYTNSHIKAYFVTDFDEYDIATGPSKNARARPPLKTVEGKVTSITYYTDTNQESVIKVYRNFMQAFKRGGIKKNFECRNKSCGPRFIPTLLGDTPRKSQYLKIDPWNTIARSANFRYWNGEVNRKGQTIYVNLLVKTATFGKYPVQIHVDVVESKPMESNMVSVNLNAIEKSIEENGKIVLDGIYFDHAKATLKAESGPALGEIAKYLNKHKQDRVFIVGHTDNTGRRETNLALSNSRAQTVVQALQIRHKIPAGRLVSVGVGEVAPVASNKTEAGRKLNRRVVMVLMD